MFPNLQKDLSHILKRDGNAFAFVPRTSKMIRGFFFKETKVFYDDGLSGNEPTFLLLSETDIKVRDEVVIDESLNYVVYRIETESQGLKRLYLKEQ